MANTPTKKPEFLRKWLVSLKRKPHMIALVVLAVDVILFTNMMNMITLRTKGAFASIQLGLFCLLAAGLVAMIVKTKKGEEEK